MAVISQRCSPPVCLPTPPQPPYSIGTCRPRDTRWPIVSALFLIAIVPVRATNPEKGQPESSISPCNHLSNDSPFLLSCIWLLSVGQPAAMVRWLPSSPTALPIHPLWQDSGVMVRSDRAWASLNGWRGGDGGIPVCQTCRSLAGENAQWFFVLIGSPPILSTANPPACCRFLFGARL